jgi:hypothetical protein
MKNGFIAALLISFLFIPSASFAAILVVSAKGDASMFENGQWKPLAKGQTLAEGVKISTGVNSSVVLNIDGSMVTVKPMTSIKIYKNTAGGSVQQTDIGLRHGAVQAKVNKLEKVKTKFTVTTPVATSSVRGTEEIVSYGPVEGMKIQVLEGIIDAFNADTRNSVSGRQVFRLLGDSFRPASVNGDIRNSWMIDLFAGNRPGDGSVNDGETVEGSSDRKDTGRKPGTSHVKISVSFVGDTR